MKPLALILFGLVALAAGTAQSALPEGKTRIIVWADFDTVLDLNDTEVFVDDFAPFVYKSSQKNVVLDLAPGRRYVKYVYHTIVGNRTASVAINLAAGQTAYLRYFASNNGFGLSLKTEKEYKHASQRPIISNPFNGGSL